MGPDSHASQPSERLQGFLRAKFPTQDGYPAKRFSKAIGCTPKTAENILDGHWPGSRHWARIAALFGQDVIDAVFGPEINDTVARLKREERRLEQLLAETTARRLQVESPGSRAEDRVAPHEGSRPAEVVALDEARGRRGAR